MFKVIGIEKVSGTYEGRSFTGLRYHCTYEKKECDGFAVDAVYVPQRIVDTVSINIGDTVEFFYNKFGKIASIQVRN